ncbi:MAG: hypothetical protein RID11_12235 [Roseovarius sp.]|uniref:hypothetical protein n=1 Tax=Roseovarius sp. TaxID=1486281 RepID=UPI0032EC3B92
MLDFVAKLGGEMFHILNRDYQNESDAGNCFNNVKRHVLMNGGDILTGWSVRFWPRVFFEAEQHAVWHNPDGDLFDVTPHAQGEKLTCFVIDKAVVFSEHGLATEVNRYMPVAYGKRLKLVRDLIEVAQARQRYQLEHTMVTDGLVTFHGNDWLLEKYREKMAELALQISKKIK